MRVAERAVGVERQAAVARTDTGVVSTVSVSFGRSMSVSPSSTLAPRPGPASVAVPPSATVKALGVGHRRVVVDRCDRDRDRGRVRSGRRVTDS